jgi:hypothetical protein
LRLAAKPLGAPFCRDFERNFDIKGERPLGNAGVRCAKHRQNEVLLTNLFLSAFGGSKAIFSFRLPKSV